MKMTLKTQNTPIFHNCVETHGMETHAVRLYGKIHRIGKIQWAAITLINPSKTHKPRHSITA
jgi:hypothetical protein